MCPSSKLSEKEDSVSPVFRQKSVIVLNPYVSTEDVGGALSLCQMENLKERDSPEGGLNSCSVLSFFFLPKSGPQCCGFTLR